MSGTTGTVRITPIPHVVSVGRLRRARRQLVAAVQRVRVAGGLPTLVAVPLAVVITTTVTWSVISVASTWVTV